MAKEKVCDKHGTHQRRKCPACEWCERYSWSVKFTTGCPRCGHELHSNGHIMSCGNDDCPMLTTSHPPVRVKVKPSDVGLRGSRI
jgi:hypothetical protein